MIDIYIPIFNSVFCAEYQIKTLRAFCKDDFNLFIIDNNCGRHPEASEDLKNLAKKEGVQLWQNTDEIIEMYQQAVEKRPQDGASLKHGWTMNLIWGIVSGKSTEYFGILDQDCFAYKPFSMIDILDKQDAYGKVVPTHPQECHITPSGEQVWNLHPVANFFRTDFLREKYVNFMPGVDHSRDGLPFINLDTGGMNWFGVYREMEMTDYVLSEKHYLYYDDTKLLDPNGSSSTKTLYEIIDNTWIHMVHGATYSPSEGYAQPKTSYIKGFLDHALLLNGTPGAVDVGFSTDHLLQSNKS